MSVVGFFWPYLDFVQAPVYEIVICSREMDMFITTSGLTKLEGIASHPKSITNVRWTFLPSCTLIMCPECPAVNEVLVP